MVRDRRFLALVKVQERAEARLNDDTLSIDRKHAAARSIMRADRLGLRVVSASVTPYDVFGRDCSSIVAMSRQ